MFIKGINGEEGEVIAVHGDSATVKIQANKACKKCNLCEQVSSTEMVVDAFMKNPVKKGDKVTLSIQPGTIVKSAAILYILPLFGLIFGYYLGKFAGSLLHLRLKGELLPAAVAIVSLFVSFIPIRAYDRRKAKDSRFRVYIKES